MRETGLSFGIIGHDLFIYKPSEEYNGLYVCFSEKKALAKINLLVVLTGKSFVNYLLDIYIYI